MLSVFSSFLSNVTGAHSGRLAKVETLRNKKKSKACEANCQFKSGDGKRILKDSTLDGVGEGGEMRIWDDKDDGT